MLMRRCLFVFSMLSVMGGVAHAQNQQIYTHVEQDSKELSDLGTAAFDVTTDAQPTVVFQDGKAVMTINDVTVATLPMSDDGELVVEHETSKEESVLNKVTKTPTTDWPYVTLYSPFQLKVPATGQVHAPIFDRDTQVLRFNSTTQISSGTIIPAETPVTIFGTTSDVVFDISTDTGASKISSGLSGSSLTVSNPTGGTIFTYGIGDEGPQKGKYGLFKYTGTTVGAGLAYLMVPSTETAAKAKYIALSFDYDDSTTGITGVQNVRETSAVGKFVKNGRLVIQKNGKMFNVSGQEVK